MGQKEQGFENINDVSIQEAKVFLANGFSLEITSAILDLDIFEHIEKPYLTAVMGFSDFGGISDFLSLNGGERVEIIISTTHSGTGEGVVVKEVPKTFYIDKILTSKKLSENEEFFIAHLIEDIGFLSKTKNVNRSYSGSGSEIMEKVADEFLARKIDILTTGEDQYMKLIVPNMNPIETLSWIKNRLTTVQGYPFYFYSTLVQTIESACATPNRGLELTDLNFLLTQAPMNPQEPFLYSQSAANVTEGNNMSLQQRRNILSYESTNVGNVFSLLEKGLIGSEYNYLDVTKYNQNEFEFDIESDVNKKFKGSKIINNRSNLDVLKYDWSNNEPPKTKKITQIGGTTSYDEWESFSEAPDKARYKNKVTAMSMSKLLVKDPININVNGYDFLDGNMNTSIGRKIRILFAKNKNDTSDTDDIDSLFDLNKSGDFLIFGCKHAIRQEGYTISMTAVKVSNEGTLEVPIELKGDE